MYKIGDKVEYLNNVWEVCDCEVDNVEMYNDKLGIDIYVPIGDVKPYRTAHEKLIEMGYEYSYKECGDELSDKWHTFYNKKRFITIDVIVNNISGIGWYITFHDPFNCIANIELSRILTQYLEELEAKE